jgi:hypothetical protein
MYASVRPNRHNYGNYAIRLQTWTKLIGNRCIGKNIIRDLSLVVSRLYRMAVTRPESHVTVTLSLSLGAALQGCKNCTKEKERKRKNALYLPAASVLVRIHESRYRLVQLNGNHSLAPAHGETPPPLGCDPKVVTTRTDTICTGLRSMTRRREEERHTKISKSDSVLHISTS